jgi:hypothetical protein
MTARSKRRFFFFGSKMMSVISGPMTTSTPISSMISVSPPIAAK